MKTGFVVFRRCSFCAECLKDDSEPDSDTDFYPVYQYNPVNAVKLGVSFLPGARGQVGHGGLWSWQVFVNGIFLVRL